MSINEPASVQLMIRAGEATCDSAGDRVGLLLPYARVMTKAPRSSQAFCQYRVKTPSARPVVEAK